MHLLFTEAMLHMVTNLAKNCLVRIGNISDSLFLKNYIIFKTFTFKMEKYSTVSFYFGSLLASEMGNSPKTENVCCNDFNVNLQLWTFVVVKRTQLSKKWKNVRHLGAKM